jgi:Animal haem peroxidase
MARDSDDFHGSAASIYWFGLAVFVVLMAIAHVAAAALPLPQAHANDRFHYYVIFTIYACILLLTPALCFHIFSRPDATNAYWRAFWTFAWVALLVHLCWAFFGSCGSDVKMVLGKTEPCRVDHPKPDLFLAAWWGLDVIIAWTLADNIRWVRVLRGAVHLLAFLMFFGAFVLSDKAEIGARLLGIMMVVAVIGCFLIHLVVSDIDPKSFLMVAYVKFFQLLNLVVVWHKLPTFLAVTNLVALREVLRAKNLHNTSDIPVTMPDALRQVTPPDVRYLAEREEDGQYNDLSKPTMGNAAFDGPDFTLGNQGARFGRNIPLSEVDPARDGGILDPNPRLVSNLLLARPSKTDGSDGFEPARILNLLAAAWIQFQTHDWFNHGNPRVITDEAFEVPIPPGDSWPDPTMRVRRTRADPTRRKNDGAGPETYANAETHWWDGSQIYGDSRQALMQYRAGREGKLKIDPNTKLIPLDPTGIERTGLTSNWWLGLSLLHNVFTLEHNAICDHVIQAYPEWRERVDGDDQIFRVARLVNNALMSKIHTVDWTPAILTHPALQVVMHADWWGLAGEQVKKHFGRIGKSEAISGIPGSATNHDGADYCLTEEFASVYRLHPLLPNDIQLVSHATGAEGRVLKFEADSLDDPDLIVGPNAMKNALRDASLTDVVYTFGVHHPGAVQLRNFPNWMRRMHRRNGPNLEELIDLAAIDIIRDRERGVPRYNRFRELFHMPRVTSFEQMSDKPDIVSALREVYGHPDKVDLMVGMYAEKPPEGFGFSDTAFRVFVLMAPRRLKSDRFLTSDFTEAVYTRAGLDWIDNNNMTTVLQRHFPELTPVLQQVSNAFAPWPKILPS